MGLLCHVTQYTMTQSSLFSPRPTVLLALAMFFMTSVVKAQLDVDTLEPGRPVTPLAWFVYCGVKIACRDDFPYDVAARCRRTVVSSAPAP